MRRLIVFGVAVMVNMVAGKAVAGGLPALAGEGAYGDAQTSLVYDASTGSLSTDPASGKLLTSINIDSAGSMFITANADMAVFNGSFDNVSANNLFKATFGSNFGEVNMGNVLPTGMDAFAVIADLTAVGSLDGGGDLGAVDLVCVNCEECMLCGWDWFFRGEIGDEQTSIVYNPADGSLGVDAPAGTDLTSINIDSAALGFNTANVNHAAFNGSFDNVAANNLFKATFGSSFPSVSFGVGVMAAGLSFDQVAGDLTAVGSLAGGGDLGAVDLIWLPEPSSLLLALLGIVGLLHWRR